MGGLVPSAEGFGSLYGARPDTLGRGHVTVGAALTCPVDLKSIDGADLTKLKISRGDDLVVRLRAEVQIDAIDLRATLGTTTARVSRDAFNVADIWLGAKYRFYRGDLASLAGRLELFLPSGSEDDILGSGVVQTNPSIIGAARLPFGVMLHGTIGFRLSSDTDQLEHQFVYSGGIEWSPFPIAGPQGRRRPALSLGADFVATHTIETSGVGFPLKTAAQRLLLPWVHAEGESAAQRHRHGRRVGSAQ